MPECCHDTSTLSQESRHTFGKCPEKAISIAEGKLHVESPEGL